MRAMIKLSGEALAYGGEALNTDVIDQIARQLLLLKDDEISLVVGGGNFWRGRTQKNRAFLNRSRSDQIGMLGTVMNGIFLAEYFQSVGLPACVMTPFAVGAFTRVFSGETALAAMADGQVAIHAGGTGHPYFSTDTAAALRAAELAMDCVFYAKNVDAVYSADPNKVTGARKFRVVTYQTLLQNQLNVVDMAALTISQEAGMDSFVFALEQENSILRAVNGYRQTGTAGIGTRITINGKEDYYV